jgi:alanine racemase
VMSHLSFAANPPHPRNALQLERFQRVAGLFEEAPASLSASAGAFLGEDYLFDMVRPGISLFGGGPQEVPDPRLRAVAILEAPILQVRTIRAGESVGYGSMFTADRDMRIGLIAAGYADGLIRTSFGRGQAAVRGRLTPLLVVSMDIIAVDLSDAPGEEGDMVELLGPNAMLDQAAAAAGTVAHECLVRLSARAERRYVD